MKLGQSDPQDIWTGIADDVFCAQSRAIFGPLRRGSCPDEPIRLQLSRDGERLECAGASTAEWKRRSPKRNDEGGGSRGTGGHGIDVRGYIMPYQITLCQVIIWELHGCTMRLKNPPSPPNLCILRSSANLSA